MDLKDINYVEEMRAEIGENTSKSFAKKLQKIYMNNMNPEHKTECMCSSLRRKEFILTFYEEYDKLNE